jgi:AraC-like DNA-binding protein
VAARTALGSGPTRSGAILRAVIGALSGLGVDSQLLLKRVGLDVKALQALPSRIPIELQNRVWEEAVRLKGDPRVGIYVAAMLHSEAHDVLRGVVRHSATLGDAIVRLARYGRLLDVGFDMRLEVQGEQAVLVEPHYPGPLLHLQGILCQITILGLYGRRLTGENLKIIEYRALPMRPPFAAQLEELMEGPIRFGAPHNALVFPSRYLHAAVRTVDRDRLRALERQAEHMLVQTPEPSFAETIEGLLALGFAGESAQAIATRLETTPRTLARRLSVQGTSYQEIRDKVRRRMAESYLRLSCRSVTDIALSLGFSDPTAFSRAFRRWTGVSPIQYREGVRGDDPSSGTGGRTP